VKDALACFTRLNVGINQRWLRIAERHFPRNPVFSRRSSILARPVAGSFTISYVTYATHSVEVPLIGVNRRPDLRVRLSFEKNYLRTSPSLVPPRFVATMLNNETQRGGSISATRSSNIVLIVSLYPRRRRRSALDRKNACVRAPRSPVSA